MNEYKDKNVLVTGGTGLIGRQVVDLLVEYGAKVNVITLDNLELNPKAKYFNYDLTRKNISLNYLGKLYMGDIDYVFHLAGIKASPKITNSNPATMSITPLQINTNVLEACRINGIKNVLFTSSIGAYSENWRLKEEFAYRDLPMDFYPGMVKRMAEYQIQAYEKEFGLKYVICRLTNNFGIGDNFNPDNGMFISSLMAKVLKGDNPVEIWGDGSNIRDFAYSKDTAKGILQMMINAKDTQPINLGGHKASVKEIVNILQSITTFEIVYNNSRDTGIKERVLDYSKAKSMGYTLTTSLYNAIKETWEWYKNNSLESLKRINYFDKTGN